MFTAIFILVISCLFGPFDVLLLPAPYSTYNPIVLYRIILQLLTNWISTALVVDLARQERDIQT